MGKLISYDPKHHDYPQQQSKTLKVMHKTLKKSVKVTYISSPLMVRACDASEFRSVVQQLTGKDSNNLKKDPTLRHHQDPPTPTCRVMQGGGPLAAATSVEDGNASISYYNGSMDSLEFDEAYFWKEVACSVPLPSYVLA